MKRRTRTTSSNKKVLIVGGAIAATGIATLLFLKNRKKRLENNTVNTVNTNQAITSSLPSTKGNDIFPLKFGSDGNNVRLWQQYLQNKLGKTRYPDKWITGSFREQTEKATIEVKGVKEVSEAMFNQVRGLTTSSLKPAISLNPFENANNGWKMMLNKWLGK